MKAQNLSICIPNFGCNKNCPYCVSNMTGMLEPDRRRMLAALGRAEAFAERLGVTTVLLTGKGEPLFNGKSVRAIGRLIAGRFRSFIVELQTNGVSLLAPGGHALLARLRRWGLGVLAVSIDRFSDITRFKHVFARARELGMVVRVAANIVRDFDRVAFPELVRACREAGVHQLTLRRITVPERIVDTDAARRTRDWISAQAPGAAYDRIMAEFAAGTKRLIRTLTTGGRVYDLDGLSFVASDYCVQERNHEDDVRSLIFAEDGHCYDGWDCRASILF
jgi:molybdenum cofactor biosynthesis enzyme MoaA